MPDKCILSPLLGVITNNDFIWQTIRWQPIFAMWPIGKTPNTNYTVARKPNSSCLASPATRQDDPFYFIGDQLFVAKYICTVIASRANENPSHVMPKSGRGCQLGPDRRYFALWNVSPVIDGCLMFLKFSSTI